jgi:hypothetical protein
MVIRERARRQLFFQSLGYFFVLVFVGVVVVVVVGVFLGCRGGTGLVISVAVYSTRVPVK